jgi:hypothetical protein
MFFDKKYNGNSSAISHLAALASVRVKRFATTTLSETAQLGRGRWWSRHSKRSILALLRWVCALLLTESRRRRVN